MAAQSFITKLLKQEDVNIEFKSKFDIQLTLQTVCAFLNGEGGWVLIGYANKKAIGIADYIEEKLEELEAAVLNNIMPQPLVYINEESYQGKKLILVNVHKGSNQPYSYDGEYYIRMGSSTKKANPDEISLLLRTSQPQTSVWEKISVTDATIDDLDKDEILATIKDAKIKDKGNSLPESVDGFLSYFKMLDYSFVSNGAMLLFGGKPAKYIPQCRIRITVMPYGKEGARFADEIFIEDNLFISYNRVIDYFTKNLPLISEFNPATGHRQTAPKYPNEALREAVINAIVHRDYSDFSGDITINIYPDKVEIINSGEIPANIITEDNKILPHHSVLRNPTIAHIFHLRGKMEKVGRGLSLIKNQFIEEGYKSPEWQSKGGYTTLTLHTESEQLNDRMNDYLSQLKKGNSFTSKEYEQYFSGSISEKTARNDISLLVRSKYINKEGQGPSTRYMRTNKELPDIAG
jgi:ATP-dependent DNA helicase RecG